MDQHGKSTCASIDKKKKGYKTTAITRYTHLFLPCPFALETSPRCRCSSSICCSKRFARSMLPQLLAFACTSSLRQPAE